MGSCRSTARVCRAGCGADLQGEGQSRRRQPVHRAHPPPPPPRTPPPPLNPNPAPGEPTSVRGRPAPVPGSAAGTRRLQPRIRARRNFTGGGGRTAPGLPSPPLVFNSFLPLALGPPPASGAGKARRLRRVGAAHPSRRYIKRAVF